MAMKIEYLNLPGYDLLLPEHPVTDNLAMAAMQSALSAWGRAEPDEYRLFRQIRRLVPYAKVKVLTEVR